MRTGRRLRLASIHPKTASQTIRKRESSSVQMKGSPRARVITPSITQTSSATTRAHAMHKAALSKAPTSRRSISIRWGWVAGNAMRAARSIRRDALPESLAPLGFELGGHARQHGLAEAFYIRLDHRHTRGLERIDELGFLRQDLVVLYLRERIDRGLKRLPLLGAHGLP